MGVVITVAVAFGGWRVLSRTGDDIDQPTVVDTAGTDTSVDAPLVLTAGTVHRMSLDANGEYYLRFAEPPGDLKLVIDMRRVDGRNSNLQSALAVLDVNGAVLQDRLINFNEIGTRARKTATLPLRRSRSIGFKLLNGDAAADFWFIVRPEPAPEFVPFLGSLVPLALIRTVKGCVLGSVGWLAGRHRGVTGVRHLCYAAGLVVGLFGGRYHEYRRTHGG